MTYNIIIIIIVITIIIIIIIIIIITIIIIFNQGAHSPWQFSAGALQIIIKIKIKN